MTTNVIIVAVVLLAIILCGVTIHLHRKIERIESSVERITLYLHMCSDGSPTAIQQCAEAMKRMCEAIGKMGMKLPIDKED
jgi:hypothetical protein